MPTLTASSDELFTAFIAAADRTERTLLSMCREVFAHACFLTRLALYK